MAFETHRAKPLPGQNPAADALIAGADTGTIPNPATVAATGPAPASTAVAAPNASEPTVTTTRAEPLHMMLKLPPEMAEKLERAFNASSRGEGRGKNAFVLRVLDDALTNYLADKERRRIDRP